MDPAAEKRQRSLYIVVWFALASVILCHLIAVAVIGLHPHVVIPFLVALPALTLIGYYVLHRKAFRVLSLQRDGYRFP